MRGNFMLAVLTLVVALGLLVPAMLASWHADRKQDRDGRAGGGHAGDGHAGSEKHRPGRRPLARRPFTSDTPTADRVVYHSVHKVTITGGPGSGLTGGGVAGDV